MNSLIRSLSNKKNKRILYYVLYAIILSILLFWGIGGNVSASSRRGVPQNYQQLHIHYVNQNQNGGWFRDGLNDQNFAARGWISWRESRNHWRILSYGHRCVGYFQLDPRYLGYRHGCVNLNHQHQVKVADHYARVRYGDWVHAKRFWQAHRWY